MIAEMNVTQVSLAGVFHVHKQSITDALAGRNYKLLRKVHRYLSNRRLRAMAKERGMV